MSLASVQKLLGCFNRMEKCSEEFKRALRRDAQLPLVIPTYPCKSPVQDELHEFLLDSESLKAFGLNPKNGFSFRENDDVLEKFEELQVEHKVSIPAKILLAIDIHKKWLLEYRSRAREYAIEKMTNYWFPDTPNRKGSPIEDDVAGVMCCSAETISAAQSFNDAKQEFKQSVIEIRKQSKQIGAGNSDDGQDMGYLERLIERVLKIEGIRHEEFQNILRKARLSRLNLRKCYAKNRILPDGIRSISWSWATAHASIEQVTYGEAEVMVRALRDSLDEETGLIPQVVAASELSKLSPHKIYAIKKGLRTTLRANIVWIEDGEILRKPLAISGICLTSNSFLPKTFWREKPADDPSAAPKRLGRSDVKINPIPVVRYLNLFEYVDGRTKKSSKHKKMDEDNYEEIYD